MVEQNKLEKASEEFKGCAPIFIALGDITRQKICLDLASAPCEGINVAELSAKTTLSRPAISHHLKVLKDAKIIVPEKRGTQIFYKLKLKEAFTTLKAFIDTTEEILIEEGEYEGES